MSSGSMRSKSGRRGEGDHPLASGGSKRGRIAMVAALALGMGTAVMVGDTAAAPVPAESSAALDTATPQAAGTGVKATAGKAVQIHVTQVGGQTILGNLTIAAPAGDGFATVFPCAEGLPVPLTSNINFASGQTVANSFATKADASGNICVTPSVDTHVIVDVVAETSALVPHNAARQLDTRQGGGARVLANGSTSIHVTNVGGSDDLGELDDRGRRRVMGSRRCSRVRRGCRFR